ncbi:MAG: hypothetical protein E7530_01540 [Ruminococcaceae bacterium]|nr:hypothetical protein [Oscillospiraceae bacterium]
MKKILAIFLSALLICISVAPMSIAAETPVLTTLVTEGDYAESASQVAAVSTTTFTVVLKAPKGIKKLVGVNLYFEFDPTVISVAKAGLAGADDGSGNITPNFNGLLVSGLKSGTDNQYAMAWIPSGDGVSKNQSRDLLFITFNVRDTSKLSTSLNLYIDEFRTDDKVENDITTTTLYENRVINFNFPPDTPPVTEGDTSTGEGDSSEVGEINGLLQVIRDMLSGNGVTFADFADAIANVLGNAEITDIIEQLIDEDIDISDLFQKILSGLGLDFGSFEDLLNKIIEFLSNLFGGGSGDGDKTTAVATTNAAAASTTAKASSSESEKTGDVGIALAATVCVVSTAAFVLTRKKKEIL